MNFFPTSPPSYGDVVGAKRLTKCPWLWFVVRCAVWREKRGEKKRTYSNQEDTRKHSAVKVTTRHHTPPLLPYPEKKKHPRYSSRINQLKLTALCRNKFFRGVPFYIFAE